MDTGDKTLPPVLSVRNLSVRIGIPPVHAVKSVSFDISKGEILGLAGESGSGKSVTALALAGLLEQDSRPDIQGSVLLENDHQNLLDFNQARLGKIRGRRIGYVFQEPSSCFNPVFTIGSQLMEVLHHAGIKKSGLRQRAFDALEQVGIEPSDAHLNSFPDEFSGGMLQRLAIACALAMNPDILVADEPTTALDTTTQKRITDLILRLNQVHGMAVLFISHDLALLKQIAPRILVMQEGLIVEQGPSGSLLANPSHPYTQSLVAAIPKLVKHD